MHRNSGIALGDLRVQLALGVALGHGRQRHRLDLAGLAGGAELLEALACRPSRIASMAGFRYLRGSNSPGFSANTLRIAPVIAMRLSVSMLILRTPCLMPRWISSTGTPQVWGISPPYWLMIVLQVLRHRGGAVHHQVGVGQAAVDLLDHVHRQHVAVRLAGELVGAVAGAHGDGQRVDLGRLRRSPRPGRDRSAAGRGRACPRSRGRPPSRPCRSPGCPARRARPRPRRRPSGPCRRRCG